MDAVHVDLQEELPLGNNRTHDFSSYMSLPVV